ncbi:MAG: DNA mismatch repair protein MutT [Rhodobacterales bacterium]|nr:MAG: DNA mismatch repair protein MutT [Rhodobacterales bacterium]
MSTHHTPSEEGSTDKTAIRNAATVIVLRNRFEDPHVLMGQRGAKAAFMPNKFVFPGGAVDKEDAIVPLARQVPETCLDRLRQDSAADFSHALSVAAIRELWEETGLILGRPGTWPEPPVDGWQKFAQAGYLPDAHGLQFVFRAITPPGRPRRFDARFFLVDAENVVNDLDDFSQAEDELSHLQWVPLRKAREFDLPFITEVVLAEVAGRAKDNTPPRNVPFFFNGAEQSLFLRLDGKGPLSGRDLSDE